MRTSTSSFLQSWHSMWLPSILLGVFCRPFWNCSLSHYFLCLSALSSMHPPLSVSRTASLMSSLEACCLTFRGSFAILVTLTCPSLAGVNQVICSHIQNFEGLSHVQLMSSLLQCANYKFSQLFLVFLRSQSGDHWDSSPLNFLQALMITKKIIAPLGL